MSDERRRLYHRLYYRAHRASRIYPVSDFQKRVTGRPPKITREQYLLLRIRAASGTKHKILAREYGLTRQSVQRIARHGLRHYETSRVANAEAITAA